MADKLNIDDMLPCQRCNAYIQAMSVAGVWRCPHCGAIVGSMREVVHEDLEAWVRDMLSRVKPQDIETVTGQRVAKGEE